MSEKLNILIVDDHPLIVEAYKSALVKIFEPDDRLIITEINSIDSFIKKSQEDNFLEELDLLFLDIKLPPANDRSLISGEDIGVELRKRKISAKVIISTTFNDNYRLYSILQNVDPDGFLVKNDLTPKELTVAIKTVMESPPFYSKTILQLMRKQISNDMILDKIDRRLLYELSTGTKMKELPNVLPLSIAGIERRKRSLKIIFDVEKEGDRGLVSVAKEKGFI